MRTIGYYTSRVQNAYSKGVPSDDSRLSVRYIYSKLNSVRARLYYQKTVGKQRLSEWDYQTLPCVEFEVAPAHECPCLPPVGCKILKSKNTIPTPMMGINNNLLESVTSIDGSIVYDYISWKEKRVKSSNPLTASKPDYYILEEYIYITTPDASKIAMVKGIFADPLEALRFPSFCDTSADPPDCESNQEKIYPIQPDLEEALIQMCLEELVNQFNTRLEDQTNNSKDSLPEQSK